MGDSKVISKIIEKYYLEINREKHHRFKSWEHCYKFFKDREIFNSVEQKDIAALHLAFYLASWGMYRGSSFLLQKDYKVHEYAVDVLMSSKYDQLWTDKLEESYIEHIDSIIELKQEIIKSYADNINIVKGKEKDINVTDTLVSKILLGVLGCVPAYDRYFIEGLKYHGFRYTNFSKDSLLELSEFYNRYRLEFNKLQEVTEVNGLRYSPMKLIDMYFWQVGYSLDPSNELQPEEFLIIEQCSLEWKKIKQEDKKDKVSIPKKINDDAKKSKSKSILSMVIEAVDNLEGEFTKKDIKDYIFSKYGEINEGTINCQTILGTVNRDSRVNWQVNKKERISNSRYDFLYDKGNGHLEKYNPDIHGLWEIKEKDGKYFVKKYDRG